MAARPRRPGHPRPHPAAALPGRQRAAPDRRPGRAAARPRRGLRPARARRTPATSYRAVEADEIMLRKNFAATGSFIAEDRPRALDLLGFSSQLVFNTFHNRRLRDWEHGERPRARRSAPPGPTTAAWSSSARSTPGCCRPATCRSPTSSGRRAMAAEAIAHGRGGAARRVGLPARPLAEPRRPRPGVGAGAGGRHPGRVPRRRHRRPHRPGVLPQRPADPARLPRRRGELPLGRLHGHPRSAGADAGDDDLRRRARALPRPAHRRDRAGRDLGAVVDAPDGVGVRGVRPPRGAAAGAVAAARASTCAARSASRRTRPRTSAGSSSRPGPRSACSRPTTRTSRAAAGRSSASRRPSATRPTTSASAFYRDNFVDLMGSALAPLAA